MSSRRTIPALFMLPIVGLAACGGAGDADEGASSFGLTDSDEASSAVDFAGYFRADIGHGVASNAPVAVRISASPVGCTFELDVSSRACVKNRGRDCTVGTVLGVDALRMAEAGSCTLDRDGSLVLAVDQSSKKYVVRRSAGETRSIAPVHSTGRVGSETALSRRADPESVVAAFEKTLPAWGYVEETADASMRETIAIHDERLPEPVRQALWDGYARIMRRGSAEHGVGSFKETFDGFFAVFASPTDRTIVGFAAVGGGYDAGEDYADLVVYGYDVDGLFVYEDSENW